MKKFIKNDINQYFHKLNGKIYVYPNKMLSNNKYFSEKDKYEIKSCDDGRGNPVAYYSIMTSSVVPITIFTILDDNNNVHQHSLSRIHLFFMKISEYRDNKINKIFNV